MDYFKIIHDNINIEEETQLIGCILANPTILPEIIEKTNPDIFYYKKNRAIFKAILTLFAKNEPVDIISVSDLIMETETKNISENIGSYLVKCQNEIVSASIWVSLNESLFKLYLRREIFKIIQFVSTKANENPFKLIDFIVNKLTELVSERANRIDIIKLTNDIMRELEMKMKGKKIKTGDYWNVSFTSRKLTDATGGFEIGDWILLAASNKSGKTKFSIQQMVHLIRNDIPVLFLSLEMTKTKVIQWMLSNMAKVDDKLIRIPITEDRKITTEQYNRLLRAEEELKSLSHLFWLDTESHLNINQVKSKIYQFKKNVVTREGVVFLDYIQRCNFQKSGNESRAMEKFASRFADISKDLGLAAVILSQMGKDAFGRYANIGDVKNSGGYTESATKIIIINNRNLIKGGLKNTARIDVVQRSGEPQKIDMEIDLQWAMFYDIGEKPLSKEELEIQNLF